MPQTIPVMAARLQRDVPTAEAKVDDAIIALSSLMTSMVTARRESGAPAKTGQATILRLAKAQMSLVDVSSDVLRISIVCSCRQVRWNITRSTGAIWRSTSLVRQQRSPWPFWRIASGQ